MPPAFPWVLFSIACVAAFFGWTQARSARATCAREKTLRSAREEELAAFKAEAAKVDRRSTAHSGELQELRKRLDKTKRRAYEAQEEVDPLKERVAALEAELRGKEVALAERDEALARAEAASAQAAATREAERVEASRIEAQTTGEASSRADKFRIERKEQERKIAALEVRAADAERETGRYRQRSRTAQRLYNVIHGELEIAKDRIRAFEGKPTRNRPPLVDGAAPGPTLPHEIVDEDLQDGQPEDAAS